MLKNFKIIFILTLLAMFILFLLGLKYLDFTAFNLGQKNETSKQVKNYVIQIGDTKEEVVNEMGQPTDELLIRDKLVWYYNCSYLVFKNNKVIKIKDDNMLFEERNENEN